MRADREHPPPISEFPSCDSARTVLDGFGQMRDLDLLLARQIGNGADQLEHPMIRPCAQIHLAHVDVNVHALPKVEIHQRAADAPGS